MPHGQSSAGVSARRAVTRERLLDAAVGAFADRGVAGASVEEISELAGFTRGAFYSNFTDKNDLCIALIERQCQVQLERTNAVLAAAAQGVPSRGIEELLSRAVEAFVDSQATDGPLTVALIELRLHVRRNPELGPTFRELDDTIKATFATVVERAMAGLGYRFILPATDVIDLIQALFDQHNLTVQGEADLRSLKGQLTRLLTALLARA